MIFFAESGLLVKFGSFYNGIKIPLGSLTVEYKKKCLQALWYLLGTLKELLIEYGPTRDDVMRSLP